jgi:hypothetical protein
MGHASQRSISRLQTNCNSAQPESFVLVSGAADTGTLRRVLLDHRPCDGHPRAPPPVPTSLHVRAITGHALHPADTRHLQGASRHTAFTYDAAAGSAQCICMLLFPTLIHLYWTRLTRALILVGDLSTAHGTATGRGGFSFKGPTACSPCSQDTQ